PTKRARACARRSRARGWHDRSRRWNRDFAVSAWRGGPCHSMLNAAIPTRHPERSEAKSRDLSLGRELTIDLTGQIRPVGIRPVDKGDLLAAAPSFQLLFSRNRVRRSLERFNKN